MNTSSETTAKRKRLVGWVDAIGGVAVAGLEYVGALWWLMVEVVGWLLNPKVRVGREALYIQLVRVGVRSVVIIVLVSFAIGMILVLQMAPPLQDFGQVPTVANINVVAIIRELGPLISAIVLTGFAGASIAAELGTMVVGEEIEALKSMALDPVRFLVVPRVVATIIGMVVLAVIANVVAVVAGGVVGVLVLDIPLGVYQANTLDQAQLNDFLTGLAKASVFGALIGLIACFNGLRVSGGAAGVGQATTKTVVHSIMSIIFADLLFTALFYALGWT